MIDIGGSAVIWGGLKSPRGQRSHAPYGMVSEPLARDRRRGVLMAIGLAIQSVREIFLPHHARRLSRCRFDRRRWVKEFYRSVSVSKNVAAPLSKPTPGTTGRTR